MKTIKSIILVSILMISGFATIGSVSSNNEFDQYEKLINFKEFKLQNIEGYYQAILSETDTNLMDPGKPNLPVYIKVFYFSKNVKIKEINCIVSGINQMKIDQKIQPAPF